MDGTTLNETDGGARVGAGGMNNGPNNGDSDAVVDATSQSDASVVMASGE